jgi:hypothetical protein
MCTVFWLENPKLEDNSEDPEVDGMGLDGT